MLLFLFSGCSEKQIVFQDKFVCIEQSKVERPVAEIRVHKNDVEVATTGYYDAYLVKDMSSIITKLKTEVISTTKKLENAKNPY